MATWTIIVNLCYLLWTIHGNVFGNRMRMKMKKVQLKGCFKLWPLQLPFFRLVFSIFFSALCILCWWNIVKIFWKRFEKNGWFLFDVETPIHGFHRLIKPDVFNRFNLIETYGKLEIYGNYFYLKSF